MWVGPMLLGGGWAGGGGGYLPGVVLYMNDTFCTDVVTVLGLVILIFTVV